MKIVRFAVLSVALVGCEVKPGSASYQGPDAPVAAGSPKAHASQAPVSQDGKQDPAALPSGHPKVPGGEDDDAAPTAKALLEKVEAMKGELKGRPKTVEILVALGGLYYDNGKYLDAIDFYRQAATQGAPYLAQFNELRGKAKDLPPVTAKAAGCDREVVKDSDPMAARATELLGQGKLAEALACSREALRPVLMAHARRGNSFYLIGNAAEAVKEHERVLEIDPDNAESLFFRGAILFDTQGDNVPQLKAAQASWEHFLATSPDSPRAKAVKEMLAQLNQAIAVGGVSKLPRPAEDDAPPAGTGGPSAPPLDPSAMQAMQGTEVKPEDIPAYDQILTEAATLLGAGKVDDARGQLVRVFPLVMAKPDKFPAPVRARAKALMGLYMQGKGAPMAGPLLAQAAGEAPEAVDALGDGLKAQGDVAHAKALWTVLQAAPGAFAGKDKLADKLK